MILVSILFGMSHLYLPVYEAGASVFFFSFFFSIIACVFIVFLDSIALPVFMHTFYNFLAFSVVVGDSVSILLLIVVFVWFGYAYTHLR